MPNETRIHTIHRRGFLRQTGASMLAATMSCQPPRLLAASPAGRPRIAAIVTEYRGYSHADVILGRFLQGHILSTAETYWPRTQVVSMYVDQFPAGDLSRGMAAQYGSQIQPSIRAGADARYGQTGGRRRPDHW